MTWWGMGSRGVGGGEGHMRDSSLVSVKKFLLKTKSHRMMNIQCALFHMEKMAFGHIELVGKMKHAR